MRYWPVFILAHLNRAMAGDNDRALSCVLTRTLPTITTEACPGNGNGIATTFVPAGTQSPVPDSPNPGGLDAFTRSSHPTGAIFNPGPPKNSNTADLEPAALEPDAPSPPQPGRQSGALNPDASGVSSFPEQSGTTEQPDRPKQPGTPETPGSGSGFGTTPGGIETPVVVGSAGSFIGIKRGIMVFAGLVAGIGPIVIG